MVGDFAPVTILAHEWGHHIQVLASAPDPGGNTFELQADCLAGVYALDAEDQGILDPGDITEAVTMSQAAADPLGLPQDQPGSHGINDDRITAFMGGYLNGIEECDLPLRRTLPGRRPISVNSTSARGPIRRIPPQPQPASSYLPSTLPVANASCFSLESRAPIRMRRWCRSSKGRGRARRRSPRWGGRMARTLTFAARTQRQEARDFWKWSSPFGSAEGARAAVPYWQIGYVPSNPNEVYICDSSGISSSARTGRPVEPSQRSSGALLDQMMEAAPD